MSHTISITGNSSLELEVRKQIRFPSLSAKYLVH